MPCSLLKKQVVVEQAHYLKLQGKQEEVNQTQALRTSCKGWALLQAQRACRQAPVAAGRLGRLDEKERKEERKVPVPF